MSFVAQVMRHADQFEEKSVHEKMGALTTELKRLTVDAHQLIEEKYVAFRPNLETCEALESRVGTTQKDMMDLEDKINNKIKSQLNVSTGGFQDLNLKLTEAKAVYEGLDFLVMVSGLLEDSQDALCDKRYSLVASTLSEAAALLKSPPAQLDKQIPILEALSIEVEVRKSSLECTLSDLWKDFVSWDIKTDRQSEQQVVSVSSLKEISICVVCQGDSHAELRELVKAMDMENLLALQMKGFSDKFTKFVVPLLLECPTLSVKVSTLGAERTLTLVLSDSALTKSGPKAGRKGSNKPMGTGDGGGSGGGGIDKTYVPVFANLVKVMSELSSMLLEAELESTSLTPGTSRLEHSGTGGTLMAWLGRETSAVLLELLQKTVVAKAVPSSAHDLEGFTDVVQAVKALHEKLVSLGYLQPEDHTLLRYVENVNMLFSNKKSQSILVEARDLMTSPLHDNVAVTEDKPMGEWPPLTPGGVKKVQRLEVAAEHQLSDNIFRMPKCRISESVQTLMTLAYETLEEAAESSPQCALQMCLAVRSMVEMFCDVVPIHHGQSLEEFPQIAALHHNNCMFIAHHLMTLGVQFDARMPPGVEGLTFVDLIQAVRESGVTTFLAQINRQRSLLLESMEGAQGFAQLEEKPRAEAAERAVKQVHLQLEHLQKIWRPVLPINNYKKAMGRLIQNLVQHCTDSVCQLEDISQTASEALQCVLSQLESACAGVLTLPGELPEVELPRQAAAWPRLLELQLVLAASLAQVSDRWAGGHGPLSLAFSASEVRQLVRALFQNTDRRAALLANIR